jgi:hypothetical protein
MDGHGNIAALIAAAITKQTEDRTTLLRLSAASWPGRDDRTVPVGREWVRAWGPRPLPLTLAHISLN